MSDIKNYEDLANAIILQAVKDYRLALKALKANPKNKSALVDKDEVERFFRSQWFTVLTSIDGETLIRSLIQEVEA